MRINKTDQTNQAANLTAQPPAPAPAEPAPTETQSPLARTLEALVQLGTPPKMPEGFGVSPRTWFIRREIKHALGQGDLPGAIKCIIDSNEPMLALSALRWAEEANQPALAGELVRAYIQRGEKDATVQLLARAGDSTLNQKAVEWAALSGNTDLMHQLLPAALEGADSQTILDMVRTIDQPACREAVLRWAHNDHREDVLFALTGQPRAARTTPPPNAAVDDAWVQKAARWAQTARGEEIRALLREAVRRGELHGVLLTLRAIPRPELAPNALLWAQEFGHIELRNALIPSVLHTRGVDAALWLVTTVGGTDFAEEVHLWAAQSGRPEIASKISEYLVRWSPEPSLTAGAEQDIRMLADWATHTDERNVMRLLNHAIDGEDARGAAVILQAAARPALNRIALLEAANRGHLEVLCALIPTALCSAEDAVVMEIVRSVNLQSFSMSVFDWARREGRAELAARVIKLTTPFHDHDISRGEKIDQLLEDLIAAQDAATIFSLMRSAREWLDGAPVRLPAQRLSALQDTTYRTADSAVRMGKATAAAEVLIACAPAHDDAQVFAFVLQAARAADVVSLARLANAGFDLGARNAQGFAPLHRLAHEGDVAGMDALISAGANLHQAGAGGFTALHIAAGLGDTRVTQFLLKQGASRRARTEKSTGALTAFQIADTLGQASTVRLLRGLRNRVAAPPHVEPSQILAWLDLAGGTSERALVFAAAPPSAALESQT